MTGLPTQMLHALGWTLLHFLWQGTALAALLAALLLLTRNASVRYALGVATLALMVAMPAITFGWINHAPASSVIPIVANTSDVISSDRTLLSSDRFVHALAAGTNRPDMMLWLVKAWIMGVLLLSVRAVGGLLWLARIRRRGIEPLRDEVYRQCLALQRRMGLDRNIRYGQCQWLDAPVVLGWFRPIVLVTAQALTGLSAQQLQAIIVHELAHIRRFDAFVNLFQIAIEMLLFYHPAVWWVSRRIRIEREVCCDHAALTVCGEPTSYARALTLMEEWRVAPSVLMAANRGPLTERVLRLLGLQGPSAGSRVAGVGVSAIGVIAALFAGYVFVAVAHATDAPRASAAVVLGDDEMKNNISADEPAEPGEPNEPDVYDAEPVTRDLRAMSAAPVQKPASVATPENNTTPALHAAPAPPAAPLSPVAPRPLAVPAARRKSADATSNKSSYIAGLAAAGLSDLTVEQLIAMKVQGITPAYVEAMASMQLRPEVDQLIAMKVQGVTPGYVDETRRLVAELDVKKIIAMKVQGITPQYIRELQATGLNVRTAGDFIKAKVQDIRPEFVRSVIDHGFRDLTLDKLIMLRRADVF